MLLSNSRLSKAICSNCKRLQWALLVRTCVRPSLTRTCLFQLLWRTLLTQRCAQDLHYFIPMHDISFHLPNVFVISLSKLLEYRLVKMILKFTILLTLWNELWSYRVRIKDGLLVWWSHRSSILTMQRTGRLRGAARDGTGTPLQGLCDSRRTRYDPQSLVSATVGRSMRVARASFPNSFNIPKLFASQNEVQCLRL